MNEPGRAVRRAVRETWNMRASVSLESACSCWVVPRRGPTRDQFRSPGSAGIGDEDGGEDRRRWQRSASGPGVLHAGLVRASEIDRAPGADFLPMGRRRFLPRRALSRYPSSEPRAGQHDLERRRPGVLFRHPPGRRITWQRLDFGRDSSPSLGVSTGRRSSRAG